jgi:hypothetical protein
MGVIMVKRQAKPSGPTKGGQIIQFRADDLFIAQLSSVADRLRTPMGVLARQWVAERLSKEVALDGELLKTWCENRVKEIQRKLMDMEAGPYQILFLLPTSTGIRIEPDSVRPHMTLLSPAERIGARFVGRINLHGFVTEKTFENSSKLNAYTQIFRTGQIESVRILQADASSKAVFGDQIDSDLIRSVWGYSASLMQLGSHFPLLSTLNSMD